MKFCCFRPSALLAPGFYPILAPEQQRITNANCSAPPLHFVSLRCSVLALSQSFRFASFFARAKTRQLRNILRARFAPCFGHIERHARTNSHYSVPSTFSLSKGNKLVARFARSSPKYKMLLKKQSIPNSARLPGSRFARPFNVS